MKFWTRVIIIGIASFILVTGFAFILAHSVSEDANQLESVGKKERNHNPQVQARIDQELRDQSVMDFSSAYLLDDQEVRDNLETEGLNMKIGAKILLFVKENASTGYMWLLDEKACDGSIVGFYSHFGEPKPADTNQGTESDEVKVVRNQMVGMPSERMFELTPNGAGECTFRLVLARPWEFSWDSEDEGTYINKIEIDLSVME